MVQYTEEKCFTQEQVQQLFLSVGWVSGQYPQRLYKALMHSSTVLTAWDGDRLVGLIRALDDSEMLAQIHYVLVHPDYQGQGIAGSWWSASRKSTRTSSTLRECPRTKTTSHSTKSTASSAWSMVPRFKFATIPINDKFKKRSIYL